MTKTWFQWRICSRMNPPNRSSLSGRRPAQSQLTRKKPPRRQLDKSKMIKITFSEPAVTERPDGESRSQANLN